MKASLLPFLCGVLLMLAAATEPADGQEKKDPGLKAPFDQYVKVEGFIAKKEGDKAGEPFVKEMVPAYLTQSVVNTPLWRVPAAAIGRDWRSLRGVVLTDKDGKKHDIKKITNGKSVAELTLVPDAKP